MCSADEVWQLDHLDDEGSKFFREFFKKVPTAVWTGGRETTKQGTYIMTSEGDFLAGHFGRCNEAQTLALMKAALKKWNEIVAQRGLKPKPVPARNGAKTWDLGGVAAKAGGKLGEQAALILQVNSRDLPGSTVNKEYAYAWNQTWLELNADEARSFLPKDGGKGSVPESVLRKLARDSLVDNVRGQTDRWSDEQIKKLSLSTETVSVKGPLVTLRMAGEFDLDAGARGYTGKLHGQAVFDTAANMFRRFELSACGMRRGATRFNFRFQEGPSPLGLCFTIEGQYDQPLPAEAATGKAPSATPAVPAVARKEVPAATATAWDEVLLTRLREELKAGKAPEFQHAALKMRVKVATADEKGRLALEGTGASLTWDFKRLASADKLSLALVLARNDHSDDCALAAYFLLANGRDEQAQEFLGCAGNRRAEILALFR